LDMPREHSQNQGNIDQKSAKTTTKYVYLFSEGDGKNKKLLGGKGAGLCEMTKIGLSVPPGFVISTQACLEYFENGNKFPEDLVDQIRLAMAQTERAMNLELGKLEKPLLVSVRSGSAVSMPGMMDTVLNLGLNDESVKGLIKRSGDERFGWDSYRRFISLFGSIVLDINGDHFHNAMENLKKEIKVKYDTELTASDLQKLVDAFKHIIEENTGKPLPQDPYEQMFMAIKAVFDSWNGKRAVDYRREFKISTDIANSQCPDNGFR
jgi:pyruvate,orthophosphate dikinase